MTRKRLLALLFLGAAVLFSVHTYLSSGRREVSMEARERATAMWKEIASASDGSKADEQALSGREVDQALLSGRGGNVSTVTPESNSSSQLSSNERDSYPGERAKDTNIKCTPDYPQGVFTPPGWQVTTFRRHVDPPYFWESVPGAATVATDEVWEGTQSVHVKRIGKTTVLYLWQAIDARQLRGRRIEVSASARQSGVPNATTGVPQSRTEMFAKTLTRESLLMPPSGGGFAEAGENVFSREPWERRSVVIDIPPETDVLIYGFMPLDAWIDDVRVTVVGESDGSRIVVNPRAAARYPQMPVVPEFVLPKPTNLDFEEQGILVETAAAQPARTCP